MDKAVIRDVEIGGKRVLMRVDFNVPMKEGRITDDSRIRATLPTIKYILEKNAILILMSHLGRPDGKVVDKYSLKPVAVRLSELLGKPVKMMNDCIGPDVDDAISKAKPGDVILLENLRFYPGEEENNEDFAKSLARHGDIYVNDAFGTAHRAHASTAGVAKFLPAVAGFLMEKEIEYLGKALESPRKPFVAVLGGAKVSDKIGVIRNLLTKVDAILIGGGMAFTFLKVQGCGIGNSLLDEREDLASSILTEAKARKVEIKLPADIVMAEKIEDRVPYKVVSAKNIPDGWIGVDIGPQTIEEFSKVIKTAKTILWNGPMGVFEITPFSKGTEGVARAIAESKATSIVGGGDSVAAVEKFELASKMSHISTGGGASLEFLEGKVLPGIDALANKKTLALKR